MSFTHYEYNYYTYRSGDSTSFLEIRHVFNVVITTSSKTMPSSDGDYVECGFQWLEKTNQPLKDKDKKNLWEPNKWHDIYGDPNLNPPAHDEWDGGGAGLSAVPDIPGFEGYMPGDNADRTLEFRFIVTSAPGCPCDEDSVSASAKQRIVIENGLVNWEDGMTSFVID